jgi:hypothetical protein
MAARGPSGAQPFHRLAVGFPSHGRRSRRHHRPLRPAGAKVLPASGPRFGRLTRAGQLVKVNFANARVGGRSERMWVLVTRIDGRVVTGMLDNSPRDPDGVGVEYGGEVSFDRGKILSVWGGPEDNEVVEEA